MAKSIIFQIDGGIGKCIASTAVIKAIRKKYPNDNLYVISGYPDVFLNNPHVTKNYQFGSLNYFFKENIENKDALMMVHNPYLEIDYVQEKKHLIQVWCEMNDLKYDGELPEMYMTNREIDFFQKRFRSDRPIFLMQTNGGGGNDLKYSFARDLPSSVVAQVIEHFTKTHNVVHVRREDQIAYDKTTPLTSGIRDILALTLMSDKRLLIDSFVQHGCSAINLKSSVCWITNNPKVLGYEIHDNILANPFTKQPELRNSVYAKFNIAGDPLEFPYNNEEEIFDVQKIIDSLEKQ